VTQPQLYQSYATEKIVSFFGAPDEAESLCNGQWLIFPKAVTCLANVGEGPAISHFASGSSFYWVADQPYHVNSDRGFHFVPAQVRRCRSDLRAEIWPAGKAAGRSIPGARPAATRYCAGQCRRPPGSPTDSTRARAVAELAVQRRRECRREEWNTQTRVAALLKRHLPIGCFSTALGNSPRSPLAGFLAKQRGTRGGLPDWWFIWREGEYFRRIKIARRDCAAEINLVLINKGRWQARHPIEVLSLKLAKIAARRCACPIELDEAPILVS